MLTVIVDTTATFVDVMMRSTRWMQVLTLCHESRLDVVIPDVVLRETARHWGDQSVQAIETANGKISGITKSREKLTELGLDASTLIDSAPVTTTPDPERFAQDTRDKLIALGVRFEAVPSHVTVETVLQRDLACARPFARSGKGFRDTLVWETVKQVVLDAAAGDRVALVTNNSNDYCDETGAIAPELLAELTGARAELQRFADLGALLSDATMAPLVAGLATSDKQLAAFLALATQTRDEGYEPPPVDEIVTAAVLNALEQLAGDDVETLNATTAGHDFTALDIPDEIESVSIDVITPHESTLSWQTYETYQDTTLLIQAEIEAEVSLVGFVYKSDLGYLQHESEPDDVYVLEWDWNDHMARVSTTSQAQLTFQIRLERGHDFVDDCELEGVQPIT